MHNVIICEVACAIFSLPQKIDREVERHILVEEKLYADVRLLPCYLFAANPQLTSRFTFLAGTRLSGKWLFTSGDCDPQ